MKVGGCLSAVLEAPAGLQAGFSFYPGQALPLPGLQQATKQAVLSRRPALTPDPYPGGNDGLHGPFYDSPVVILKGAVSLAWAWAAGRMDFGWRRRRKAWEGQ